MIPFRVFDKKNKQVWQVINYHPHDDVGGSYLLTRENDSEDDGDMKIIPGKEIVDFKFIDFVEEGEPFGE